MRSALRGICAGVALFLADLGVRYVGVDPAASRLAAEKAAPELSDTGEATLHEALASRE